MFSSYGLAQQALVQSEAHTSFLQQDFSPQQDFFAQQDFVQPAAQPPVAAQELRAMEDSATRDINDRLWITFFIIGYFVFRDDDAPESNATNTKSIMNTSLFP